MLRVTIREVRPGHEARLRAWLAELGDRADEVRETFRQEGVRHEQAYLVDGPRGLLLVYASEADDHDAARRAFEASTLPIDAEHRAVMGEALGATVGGPPVFDVRRPA